MFVVGVVGEVGVAIDLEEVGLVVWSRMGSTFKGVFEEDLFREGGIEAVLNGLAGEYGFWLIWEPLGFDD